LIHFTSLEESGLSLAAMSDKRDGNCGSRPEAYETATAFLNNLGLCPDQLFRIKQVHGIRIVDVTDISAVTRNHFPEADGVITNCPGVPLGISVADCAPVLLYNPVQKAIAALHSGREGVRQNIAAAGIHSLCATYGGYPDQLLALIGPCAGVCCYEVSQEMAQIWTSAGLPAKKRNLNLPLAIQQQLENCGVIRHNIAVVPHCTICGGCFYSYRADKTSHRNLVIVML